MNTNPTDPGIQIMDEHNPADLEATSPVKLARTYVALDQKVDEYMKSRREVAAALIKLIDKSEHEFPLSVRMEDGKLVHFDKKYSDSIEITKPSEELK